MTRLDEIKERMGKATPGPWAVPNFAKCGVESVHEDRSVATTGGYYSGQLVDGGEAENEANAQFIANAPADIAWLLGEVERLEEELEQAKKDGRDYWLEALTATGVKLAQSDSDLALAQAKLAAAEAKLARVVDDIRWMATRIVADGATKVAFIRKAQAALAAIEGGESA